MLSEFSLLFSWILIFVTVKQETVSLFHSETTLMAEINLDMEEGDTNLGLLFNHSSIFSL